MEGSTTPLVHGREGEMEGWKAGTLGKRMVAIPNLPSFPYVQ